MPENADNLLSFWQELKRRKVVRVIIVYAAASFVILELVSIIAEPFGLPDWTLKLVFVILCVGFIISIILSWIYDITPKGIEKTRPVKEAEEEVPEKPSQLKAWKIATYISVVVIIVMVIFNVVRNTERSRDIQKLEKTIAVLPFENWNSDEENAHMGDAIANEINTQLSKIKEFHVFSYTSSSHYKGSDKPSAPQIGKELGANFIIEGSVERQDEDVSIHVQVIQAENDDHIWAYEFKDKWKKIFTIRAQIAVRIAEELKTVLSPEEIERIEKKPTENLEAYKFYLRGMYYFNLHQDFLQSAEYFEKSIQLDSTYALAYSYLTQCYQFIARYSLLTNENEYSKTKEKAKEAILKAIELDPSIGEAHASHGLIMAVYDWDIYGPERIFKKAIKLSPGSSVVYSSYVQYLRWLGRYDESISLAKQALELDPLNPMSYMWLALLYTYSGQYVKSNQQLEAVLNLNPDFNVHFVYAYNYTQIEMYDKAIVHADKVMSTVSFSDNLLMLSHITWVYAKSGLEDKARKQLEQMLEISKNQYVDPVFLAISYTGLGEIDNAFASLSRAFEIHSGQMIYLRGYADFLFKELGRDPRYNDLLVKIGFKVD